MKKINILIAVLAMTAAASMAGAEDIKVGFDSAEGVNITAKSIAMEDQDSLPTPAFPGPENMFPGGETGQTCCGFPMGQYGMCMAVCPTDSNFDLAKAVTPESFKGLELFYAAQAKIKKAAVKHYTAKNETALAAAFSAKEARVAAEKGEVYLVTAGKVAKIYDPELAGTIIEIVRPEPQTKLIDPLTGAIIIVGCMQDEDCWNAVGDGVSMISEWLNS